MKVDSVFVVGLGGTGSILLDSLVRLITYHSNSQDATIYLVDGDIYESGADGMGGNLKRQTFPASSVGKSKAAVSARRVADIGAAIKYIPEYLNGQQLNSEIIKSQLVREEQGLSSDGLTVVIATVKLLTP